MNRLFPYKNHLAYSLDPIPMSSPTWGPQRSRKYWKVPSNLANQRDFPAKTRTYCLFHSNIKHGYDLPNQGEERISLAFNVMLNGIGLFYQV